ncbi:MAG: CPBP family intramembrane metalloprotease [Chlamydiae bacterium]|nr:CPBP family intramembrane metalloprotease [Chlamydiota bacterium]MBI3266671.1 CPBP family intramembrane metalloprotease [Chlamydiota bacterium]
MKGKRAGLIYWNFGKNTASLFVLLELGVLILRSLWTQNWLIALFHFVTLSLAITTGMMLCRKLKRPSLPVILSLSRARHRLKIQNLLSRLKIILLYSLLICSFTYILFKLFPPLEAKLLENHSGAQVIPVSSALFFILVAFYEESIFRLFLQTFLAYLLRKKKGGVWMAIIGSSLIFATAHLGILSAWEIKFTQTFLIGLALGHLMNRYGLETAFFTHAILNIFALYTAPRMF